MLIVILVQLVIIIYLVFSVVTLEEENKQIKKEKKQINKENSKFSDKNYQNLIDKMNLEKKCIILKNELDFYKYLDKCYLKEEISTINENKLKINPIFETKRILVGDYNLEMLNHTRKIFMSLGFEVDTVQTGMDLINRVTINNNYDVIITNNLYKDSYDGEEILLELKELEDFNTPVVVLTVSTGQEEYFIKKGFDGYLEKALTQEQAEKVMKKILYER